MIEEEGEETREFDESRATDRATALGWPSLSRWSLPTLLTWLLIPLACISVGGLWLNGMYRTPQPAETMIWSGLGFSIAVFAVLYIPLWILFAGHSLSPLEYTVCAIVAFLLIQLFPLVFYLCGVFFLLMWVRFKLVPNLAARTRATTWTSTCLLLSYIIYQISVEILPPSDLILLREQRLRYPSVDLRSRVEKLSILRRTDEDTNFALLPATDAFQQRLQDVYDQLYSVEADLRLLHSPYFERYVRAPRLHGSSGAIRLWVEKPPSPKLKRPETLTEWDDYVASSEFQHVFGRLGPLGRERRHIAHGLQLNRLTPLDSHYLASFDFAHPSTLGAPLDTDWKFVGFSPHAMTYPPLPVMLKNRFRVEKVQLISVLREGEPVVYETAHYPDLAAVIGGQAQPRTLTGFEAVALESIRQGHTIAVREDSDRLFTVGALRTITQCQTCHQSQPGDLLGALSYEYSLLP